MEAGSPAMRTIWLTIAICLLACALRLTYVVKSQLYAEPRRSEMERAAATLEREGFLGNVYSDSSGKSAHIAPLYAIFLAGIYFLFGWDTTAGRLLQELFAIAATVIGICSMPFIARKARLSMASGWAAAFCMAVLPVNLWIETSGVWEQPYAALALFGLFWAFCTLHENQWRVRRTVILTGGLLGATALFSPSLLPAGALMFMAELWSQQGLRKRIFVDGFLMLAISIIIITPWIVRNYYVFGGFIPVRSNFGMELATGNNPDANGRAYATSWDNPEDPFYRTHLLSSAQERAKLMQLGERGYMKEKQQIAFRWIRENPGKFARLTLTRFGLFWFPPVHMWPPSSPARVFKSLVFCLIGMGMFCGLCRLGIIKHPSFGLLFGAVFGASVVYMVTYVDSRYRYPMFGLSTLLACDLVISTGKQWSRKQR